MANHIKFCSCKACRSGRHAPASKAKIRQAVRHNRRAVKVALRLDREAPRCFSVGYTD